MEYSAGQQADIMARDSTWPIAARAMEQERAVPDEPRFLLNARGQAFVADTLGLVCDSPLTNAEISMIAEKIEQNLGNTVPQASLLIQLAVVGQTPAEISRLMGMSPVTAGRHLRAIRRALDVSIQAEAVLEAADAQEPLSDELSHVPTEQLHEIAEEPAETQVLAEQPNDIQLEEELPMVEFHSVTAGSLRGGIYRALKEYGVKGYGVIEMPQLAELVESVLVSAAVSRTDRQAYRGYLQTNKPLFIDNPARVLMTEVPKLIAELLVQEVTARPAATELVVAAPVLVEQVPPARAVRRRVGRTAVARTPLRPAPIVQSEVVPWPTPTEQLPLDVVSMNRLRGGVFRALHGLGVALPTSLEHDQLYDYARQVMTEQIVTPEVQVAYDRYLRTCHYTRSDTELSQVIATMPEWVARQIMTEQDIIPGEPVQPEVLAGHKELHTAERQRQAAIAEAELETARTYLTGTDWERRQALVSIGGDTHWLSLFDRWCSGADPEAIAADSRYDAAMVRRQLLHMAKAAYREKPAAVTAAPSADWVEDALCAQTDPEIFFPEKGGSTRDAKKVCDRCNVRAECEADRIRHKDTFGFRGGLSIRGRKRQLPVSAR